MNDRALPVSDADRALDAAIDHAVYGAAPLVIVNSPPGAGKTYLVECAAVTAAVAAGMRVMCLTPGVAQAYDVAERLLAHNLPRLELVHAKHRETPPALRGQLTVSNGWSAGLNVGAGVVVANAHIVAAYRPQLLPGSFDLLIVDEAYQLSANNFLPVADLAPRVLMVGDPGQLPPVISVDTSNFEAHAHPVHWAVPLYLLRKYPQTPVYSLPSTRRLLPDAARLVQHAFYPDLPFASVVDPATRRLRFPVRGIDAQLDPALDALADGASIVAVVLPGSAPAHEETDPELAAVMAALIERILVRQGTWMGQRQLGEADIGCIDPNVLTGGAVSDRLRRAGLRDVRVDTVERWQGLEVPIAVVRHPLSRVGDPEPFDLQAGRWCVSLSRHRLGCIIVGRASVEDVLREYVHPCDTAAAGARDDVWSGFQAHRSIWAELRQQGRLFRLGHGP
jgi:hypothetical protein